MILMIVLLLEFNDNDHGYIHGTIRITLGAPYCVMISHTHDKNMLRHQIDVLSHHRVALVKIEQVFFLYALLSDPGIS